MFRDPGHSGTGTFCVPPCIPESFRLCPETWVKQTYQSQVQSFGSSQTMSIANSTACRFHYNILRTTNMGNQTSFLARLGSFPGSARFFSFPQRPDRLWDPHSLLSKVYRGYFPGVKRQARIADHSPPTSAEVKKSGAIPPLSHLSSWHTD
jgi:hypothetical protein